MNLIAADLMPDLRVAQVHTPGELPTYSQGENSSGVPPTPAEQGTTPGVGVKPAGAPKPAPTPNPLPQQRPPRGNNASI